MSSPCRLKYNDSIKRTVHANHLTLHETASEMHPECTKENTIISPKNDRNVS